jgi:DNA-binding transcriptional ArsR family regulator
MSRPRSLERAGVARAAPVFAALGDATRLQIVVRLCTEGPLSIASLSDGAEVTRQAVTKHVHALARAGLVRRAPQRGARSRAWELTPRRFDDARRYLDLISRQWDDALERLRTHLGE